MYDYVNYGTMPAALSALRTVCEPGKGLEIEIHRDRDMGILEFPKKFPFIVFQNGLYRDP